jgi:CheY-like chemotaxis protein
VSKNHSKKTILVVEDDREIGEVIIEVLLEETLYHAYLVTNAHDGLRLMKERKPDLLLLDYQLPSMTGLQFFDQIQTMEGLQGIPTIMISANLPWSELEKRGILGLEKPFDLDTFVGLVKKLLATVETHE